MESLLSFQESLGECSVYFTAFGALVASYISLKTALGFIRFLRDYCIGSTLGLSANVKKAGQWAVVTGCTDGIGKAYAEQLAKKGLNVVLISRTQEKLDNLAREIESQYNVKTRVIAADFTRTDIYDRIQHEVQGLEIGVLVNNVGISYKYPMYFLEVPDTLQFMTNLLNCNLVSMMMMTKIVLPSMLERHRGYVINISSSSSEGFVPLLSLYAASKLYMDYFTKCMQYEYASKGVTFQSVKPGFVATKLSGIRKSNLFVPFPNQYVRSALGTLGLSNSTNGFWSHRVMTIAANIAPVSMTMKAMTGARKRAIKREETKKGQ